jgi:hypothetical protein
MPNLMPGKPGTKEAFGISVIRDNYNLIVPPKALEHYNIAKQDTIVLTTGRKGKSGFGLIKRETALANVFSKHVKKIKEEGKVYSFNNRDYVMLKIRNGKIKLNENIVKTFLVDIGLKLMVVKSTTVTMSFTPIDMWIDVFKKNYFTDAIKNIGKLEVY